MSTQEGYVSNYVADEYEMGLRHGALDTLDALEARCGERLSPEITEWIKAVRERIAVKP